MKHQAMAAVKDQRARAAIDRYGELEQHRRKHERMWAEIACFIRPQRAGFHVTSPTLKEYQAPLSSTPIMAHQHFSSGIYSGLTNPAVRWGGLTTPDEDLNAWPPFAQWLERQEAKVNRSFSPSNSNFYPSSFQAYGDIAAFGNAAGYDELDEDERRFIDVTVNLCEIVADIDFHGRVNEVVRKFPLTARQAVRQFGKDALPKEIGDRLEAGGTDTFQFYHHVFRNDEFEPFRLGSKGKRWLSRYATEADETLVREGGYQEMPFYYPRWDVDTGETYGVGPGFTALPAAKVNHRMQDAIIRSAQWAADPLRLLPDRNTLPLDGEWRPGGAVYNAMVNGRSMIGTETFSGNVGLTIEQQRAVQDEIREAYFYSTMSLTNRTGISDEENRVLDEARLRSWAPHADRVMEEWAARKYARRWQLLLRAGQIDPVPEGTPKDAQLMIRYQSAAAMALRASEANAVRRFVADLAPVMEIDPNLRHRLSSDDYAEVLHSANTILPQRLLRTREEAAERAQAEQNARQMAQMAELAKTGGQAVRDVAQGEAALAQAQEGEG
ncbi:portal protein [Roseovarius atlanticus]|uniref:portal protein n=1 Tax=Roseovarius atlanticus TaxID=1641875 RepID=UPI001C95C46D|nr:portal protein [Roseovarius atlanticus]MBY5988208.1 head-tail connector protein [Roseovarius atlanticus]MBY6123599.1 head-tail connector protein [Roseovarius atlanticus]MBY6148094.1 head-tail connector protein [Roseovarius atlanticus]